MERFGLKEGIWICNYTDFKGLCFVIRESLIQLNSVLISQENKADKMSIPYNYLISKEFITSINTKLNCLKNLDKL